LTGKREPLRSDLPVCVSASDVHIHSDRRVANSASSTTVLVIPASHELIARCLVRRHCSSSALHFIPSQLTTGSSWRPAVYKVLEPVQQLLAQSSVRLWQSLDQLPYVVFKWHSLCSQLMQLHETSDWFHW